MSATRDEYYDRLLREVLSEAPHLSTEQIGEGYRTMHRPEILVGEPSEHPHVRGCSTVRVVYRDRVLSTEVEPDGIAPALETGWRVAETVGADFRANARQHVVDTMVSGGYLSEASGTVTVVTVLWLMLTGGRGDEVRAKLEAGETEAAYHITGKHPTWRFRLLVYKLGEVEWRRDPKTGGNLHPVWADTGLPVGEPGRKPAAWAHRGPGVCAASPASHAEERSDEDD